MICRPQVSRHFRPISVFHAPLVPQPPLDRWLLVYYVSFLVKFSFILKIQLHKKTAKTNKVRNITIRQFTEDEENTMRVHKTSEICMEKNFRKALSVKGLSKIGEVGGSGGGGPRKFSLDHALQTFAKSRKHTF